MTQMCERSPFWVSPYAPDSGVDDAPVRQKRLEGYYGPVLAKAVARCAGCWQVVMYETPNGNPIEAKHCRCPLPKPRWRRVDQGVG